MTRLKNIPPVEHNSFRAHINARQRARDTRDRLIIGLLYLPALAVGVAWALNG